jgi:hypothetical protein
MGEGGDEGEQARNWRKNDCHFKKTEGTERAGKEEVVNERKEVWTKASLRERFMPPLLTLVFHLGLFISQYSNERIHVII